MQTRSDIVPIGGLNTDSDPRHYEQGDYKEARNVIVRHPQNQGDEGLVQTLRSTSAYTMPVIDSDVNQEYLSVVVDEENDRVYKLALIESMGSVYFVIYKHDIIAETVKIIFQQLASLWGIFVYPTRTQLYFYNARIVDGKIIWTDNENDIRQMDVEKMERTWDAGIYEQVGFYQYDVAFNTGYIAGDMYSYQDKVYEVLQDPVGVPLYPSEAPAYYDEIATVDEIYLDPMDPNNFTLAALPPLIAPSAVYLPDYTKNVNQLRGKTWQFSYQYVYTDYRKSTYAPPSLVPAPSQEELITGDPVTDPSVNNMIRLTVNTGNEQVRYINVIARNSEDISTWFEIDKIYVIDNNGNRIRPSDVDITLDFYNDKIGSTVVSADVYNLFSYVPVRAKHMELIEGNRLVFGNLSEGYARVPLDVTMELSWEDLSGITTQDFSLNTQILVKWIGPDWFYFGGQIAFYLPTINPGACTFKVRVKKWFSDPFVEVQYVYNGTDPYPSTVKTGIQNAIDAQWSGEVTTCWTPSSYSICAFPREGLTLIPHIGWETQFLYTKAVVSHVDKYPCLKTGATHSWGIIYRDIVGRVTPVNGSGEMTMYIPFPTENTSSNVGRRANVSFKINHAPPPQAASYEVVYAGNKSTSWHLQLMVTNFSQGRKNHEDPADTTWWTGMFRARLTEIMNNTRDEIANYSVEQYVWQKGDRIRIIGRADSAGILTEINDAIYDVEVMGIYTDTDYANMIGETTDPLDETPVDNEWIYFRQSNEIGMFVPLWWPKPNYWADNLLIELYRPYVVETNLFFTTGMTYAIGTDVYGNKIHLGSVDQVRDVDGNPVTPATVYNTAHDSWKYLRPFRNYNDTDTFSFWVESEFASDFYITNKLTSRGSPIPDIDSQQQNVLTKRLRHGGRINIGSQINNLADFDYDDYLDLKDEHGPIEGLRYIGFTLNSVQYNKVTGIYIGRQESFSASGDPQYLFTDKVFGSARPEMENYGTAHPGSVIVNDRNLYFWDQSEGVVIRKSANGQVPISSYKMKRYFIDKAKSLDEVADIDQRVQFAYSNDTEQLFCLFGSASALKEIVTFTEGENRWKSYIDLNFNLGQFYWIGKRLYHVYAGVLYEWYKGSDYLNIGGTVREGKMVFYSSADPAKPMTYQSVIVYQRGAVPIFGSVDVPARATSGAEAMSTDIYPVNIREVEGAYYCQILRDKNTPGPGTENYKLMNGRELRGTYVQVELLFNETTVPVTLSNIIVLSTPSERSK